MKDFQKKNENKNIINILQFLSHLWNWANDEKQRKVFSVTYSVLLRISLMTYSSDIDVFSVFFIHSSFQEDILAGRAATNLKIYHCERFPETDYRVYM